MANILVIDDDDSIRFLVQEELSLEGHAVRTAADGCSALKAVRAEPPDAVILDIKMPGLGGLEVLRRLKVLLPNLPVFMFTAYSDYRAEARDLGADGYFVKTPDLEPIKAAIRQSVAGRNGSREA